MGDIKRIVIDVSHHNGDIDWERVKSAGYHAILRCGHNKHGSPTTDGKWERNIEAVERLGIPHGVYYYSYSTGYDALEAAMKHVKSLLSGRTLQYPVYFDAEEEGTEKFAKQAAAAFCRNMEHAGYWAGIYANQNWWRNYLSGLEKEYTPWVARYSSNAPTVPYDMWQYSSTATVPGCGSRNCDISACYRDFPAEIAGSSPAADTTAHQQTTAELAAEVLKGSYGNGAARKQALGDRYQEVQDLINAASKRSDSVLATMVIDGDFGNGETRKALLGSRYKAVQAIVNRMM